ncbi:MAG: methyl-accepting chemotaxis protein [Methanobacteriota archaeon]
MDEKGLLLENQSLKDQLEESRKEASKYREVLNAVNTPVIAIDTKQNITYINISGSALIGKKSDELIGVKCDSVFQTNDCQGGNCATVRSMREKKPLSSDTVARIGGKEIPIRYEATPLIDDTGTVIGAVEFVLNLTETKKALYEVNRKVAYLDAIPTPVLAINTKFMVEYINPAGAAVAGITQQEAFGKKCFELFHTGHCNSEQCNLMKAMTKDGVFTDETVARLPSGELNIRYTGAPLKDNNGEITGAIEFILDITEEVNAASEVMALIEAGINGNLKARGNPDRFKISGFKKIMKGFNEILDAITRPVNEALRVSQSYAKYQFSDRIDPNLEVQGDWIEFKDALNSISTQVSAAIHLINTRVNELSSAAVEVNASIEEVSAGTQQIALNTSTVSKNSRSGSEGILQILKAMEDLSQAIEAVSRRAESVSTSSDEANEHAKTGIELAKRSETTMGEITRSTEQVDILIKDINGQMNEIGKIIRMISDIANQTNLLALNAAIEAARAGEAGRGFAVVAAEVKALAQDSRQSAENIADMISNLQTKAKKATEAIDQTSMVVRGGSDSLIETLSKFNLIAESIEMINSNIVEVASASEEQSATIEEMTAGIQELSDLISNNANEVESAAAATEETSATMSHISDTMNNVVVIVESVTEEINKFKV